MPRYFDFHVAMPELETHPWRRFLLRTTSTFFDLHKAIQVAFGWQDYHLFEFRLPGWQGRCIAGLPEHDEVGERLIPQARREKLSGYFWGGLSAQWCEYVYDFGDDWLHDVKLMGMVSDKQAFKRRLLDGAGSGPPEDCGGSGGFENILHFLRKGEDLNADDPESLRTWLGDWRPDSWRVDAARATFDR